MWPHNKLDPLVTIFTLSAESLGSFLQNTNNTQLNNASSVVWPAANRAIFIPFAVFRLVAPKFLFVLNGATAAGNIDVGIYSYDGTRLWSSGSTAQAGTSTVQTFAVSGLELVPGQYYFAAAMNGVTGTLYRSATGNTNFDRTTGCAQMASAFPLPATATLAAVGTDYLPLIGLTTRSVV